MDFIFTLPLLFVVLYASISINGENNFTVFYLIVPIILLGFIGRYIRSKELILVNEKGINIVSAINKKFDSVFFIEQIVSIIFRRGQVKNEEDCIKINFINNGKMKKKVATFSFSYSDMESMGNYFMKKKIPVKFDGFDIKLKK